MCLHVETSAHPFKILSSRRLLSSKMQVKFMHHPQYAAAFSKCIFALLNFFFYFGLLIISLILFCRDIKVFMGKAKMLTGACAIVC